MAFAGESAAGFESGMGSLKAPAEGGLGGMGHWITVVVSPWRSRLKPAKVRKDEW